MKKLILIWCFIMSVSGAHASLMTTSTETIDVGTHNGTYASNVRGFWFTAPVDFWIVGIDVPTDASTANFATSILRLPSVPPSWSSSTNVYDILFEVRNQATAISDLAIKVEMGDVIGVLGNRGDVNSYGTSPYTSSILGNSVALTRFGTQNVISSSASVAGMGVWTENGGSISRVNLTISATDPSVESVPAPATLSVLMLGLCGLFFARRNTKRA